MSLVNEALKKAHGEASRKRVEATNQTEPRPAPRLYAPEIRKPNTGFVIALIATVFTVVLSATVLRVTASSGTAAAGVSRGRTTPPPAVVASIQPRVSLSMPHEPTPSEAGLKIEKAPETSIQASTDLGRVQLPSANHETVTQSFTPSAGGIVEGKVYLQSLNLPNAPTLSLNGILWSDKPLAVLNNITVSPGEEISDVTVIAIEPKRVKLQAQGKEFFIRLP